MSENSQDSYSKQLSSIGILNSNIKFNFSSKQLSEISVKKKQAKLTSTNAISINTGKFTGRSPEDRFIVEDENTKDHIWWGDINKPFISEKFGRSVPPPKKLILNGVLVIIMIIIHEIFVSNS